MTRTHLLVLTTAMLAGCQTFALSCTDAGCESGIFLELDGPADPGDHTLVLTFDSTTVTCVVDPANPGAAGEGCDGPDGLVAFYWVDGRGLQANVYGTTPAELDVLLTGPSGTLVDETIFPAYSTLAPNGEACGPICDVAEETFTW